MLSILVVEDGNGMYQPVDVVASDEGAILAAERYMAKSGLPVVPNEFVIWENPGQGTYTRRRLTI